MFPTVINQIISTYAFIYKLDVDKPSLVNRLLSHPLAIHHICSTGTYFNKFGRLLKPNGVPYERRAIRCHYDTGVRHRITTNSRIINLSRNPNIAMIPHIAFSNIDLLDFCTIQKTLTWLSYLKFMERLVSICNRKITALISQPTYDYNILNMLIDISTKLPELKKKSKAKMFKPIVYPTAPVTFTKINLDNYM